MNRRQFLSATAVSAAGILFSDEAFALADNSGFWRRDRLLEMRRADTGERRIIRFYAAGRGYLQDGYLAARWFLRDAKDGNAVVNIDAGLSTVPTAPRGAMPRLKARHATPCTSTAAPLI